MSRSGNVVITDFLLEAEIEAPVFGPNVKLTFANGHTEEDLVPYLAEAEALMLFHDIPMVTEKTFALAPKLKTIVRAGVGYNNVDLVAAGKHGIAVCNVPDYGTEEVADHAIGMLLSLVRHLPACDASMRKGEWDYTVALPTPRLRGKTLGLIGCGRIGGAMALRAKAFGLDVVFYDPYIAPGLEKALGVRRSLKLEPMLRECHFLSLHCYLGETSTGIINEKSLAMLRPGAILINTARGPVVEQEALIAALESGHLYAAGIDVFEREPLDDDRLRNHPRVILSPHSAFYSVEGFVELRTKTAQEIARILDGEPPLNLVNGAHIQNARFVR
jgi:phosphoglycerate dehydrogenase-like enzyme